MKNMTFKEKTLFILLQIITFGLIWIYWNKKSKTYKDKNSLSQEIKVNINVNKFIEYLGGKENIKNISNTHTKIKIDFVSRNLIQIEEIKSLFGISGIFMNDISLTVIVGNNAKATVDLIKSKL